MALDRPPACRGCSLDQLAAGFAQGVGPWQSALYFLGESLGGEEVKLAQPFVGPAGTLLNRALGMARIERGVLRIGNVISCQPPGNELIKKPWEHTSIAHCRQAHLQPDLERWLRARTSQHPTLVALGNVPLTTILDLPRGEGIRVQDFHGTVTRDPSDRFWVTSTYHPKFIQHGAFNLLGVLVFDLLVAMEVAEKGHVVQPADLICDPSVDRFAAAVDLYLAEVAKDPEQVWLAVDIETPDKEKQSDEGELTTTKDRSFTIIRVNVCWNVDEGWTVPFTGPYIHHLKRMLASRGPKIFWGYFYDGPRLKDAQVRVNGPILDFMWAWHKLQSDLPRGLGFVSPFYSKYGPWKHLSRTDPVTYAAIDGVQTLRCAHGIAADLDNLKMFEVFWRHIYELDTYCLWPSEETGFAVDKEELARMKVDLQAKREGYFAEIQSMVPKERLVLFPKEGWTEQTLDGIAALNETRTKNAKPLLLPEVLEQTVTRMVKVCVSCGAEEIAKTHRCKDKTLTPQVDVQDRPVKRYYAREQFNPGSAPQILAYIVARGHKPGKNKKTKRPTSDKATLSRLAKQEAKKKSGDRLYGKILMFREVSKVETTYVDGTYRRLASDPRSLVDGRLHPTTGHKPSTQRTSMQGPNLQNVIADRRGKEALAAGFRKVLVAVDEEGEQWQPNG